MDNLVIVLGVKLRVFTISDVGNTLYNPTVPLKTLWVFSSKEALINASSKTANKNPDFTVTPISEIMQFCDEVGIEKMIIDELLPLHRAKN